MAVVSDAAFGNAARGDWPARAVAQAWHLLTAIPTDMSCLLASLCAVAIAVVYLTIRGGRSCRRLRPRRLLKVLLAPSYFLRRTHGLDVLMAIFNTRVVGWTIGILLISGTYFAVGTYDLLVRAYGPAQLSSWPPWAVTAVSSVILWLSYEFAYWLDHYLSHRVPFLWEFHKVHHQAETLSPLTVFRVHPIDSLVFVNILAICIGSVNGILHFSFGIPIEQVSYFGYGLILAAFSYLIIQLQHSHVWIPFCGIWGRLFISPAHHQIHHSDNPAHFNKNLGSCLAIFDWLFGSLHVPSRQREKLSFGVAPMAGEPHTLTEGLVLPFERSWRHIAAWLGMPGGRDAPPETPSATGSATQPAPAYPARAA